MASVFGDDGGTFAGGRRRPTNAGYGTPDPFAATPPFGMPGTPTNPNTGYGGTPGAVDQPTSGGTSIPGKQWFDSVAVPTQRVSSLMEGDAGKLADPTHIAGSPKYQFLSLAPFYGRGQEGDLLHQLQSQYGQYWNGWSFDGKGNFNYGGDPSKLDRAWGGVTSVDAYGHYGDGGQLAARWGVDDGGSASDPMAALASLFGGSMGHQAPPQNDMSWLGPLLQSVLQGMGSGTPKAPAAPATTPMTAPPISPSAGYSQPSPSFGGGYVNPGYAQPGYGSAGADATSLLSMALPRLMSDPSAANDPLVRQILQLVRGGQ